MLQQTRVEVVRDYYQRWIRAFPTVESLARAPFSRVLKLWEGLGYYSRAKNLHRAAKIVVGRARSLSAPKPGAPNKTVAAGFSSDRSRESESDLRGKDAPVSRVGRDATVVCGNGTATGESVSLGALGHRRTAGPAVPTTVEQLMELPGIGRYTAGAIASIAFDQPAPLVDGNVARVFARIFGIRADVTKPATQKLLWEIAAEILPDKCPGTFNQALMELGALLCTPANPRCAACPMNRVCLARAKDSQNQLPNRGKKQPPKLVVHSAALVRRGDRILLRRRPARGLLAGMWELPPLSGEQRRQHTPLLTIRHTITNRRITLRVFECEAGPRRPNRNLRWASPGDVQRLTLPAAHRRAVETIGIVNEQGC